MAPVMDGVQLSYSYKPTTKRQFPFYHSAPRFPIGTQLIALGRMKG